MQSLQKQHASTTDKYKSEHQLTSAQVADVKQKVAATNGFEAANIKLIWSGEQL